MDVNAKIFPSSLICLLTSVLQMPLWWDFRHCQFCYIVMWFSIWAMMCAVSKACNNLKVKSIYASSGSKSGNIYFSTDEIDSQTPFLQQLFSRLGASQLFSRFTYIWWTHAFMFFTFNFLLNDLNVFCVV